MSDLLPFRVYKNDRIIDSKKHAGEAINVAKEQGADEVYYLNTRNFGVTVWHRDWSRR